MIKIVCGTIYKENEKEILKRVKQYLKMNHLPESAAIIYDNNYTIESKRVCLKGTRSQRKRFIQYFYKDIIFPSQKHTPPPMGPHPPVLFGTRVLPMKNEQLRKIQ
jgi:hypothetical protein